MKVYVVFRTVWPETSYDVVNWPREIVKICYVKSVAEKYKKEQEDIMPKVNGMSHLFGIEAHQVEN